MRSETEIKAMIEFLETDMLKENPEYSSDKIDVALSILKWIVGGEKPKVKEEKEKPGRVDF